MIKNVLKKHNISHGYLPGTRDIWCREYMPVQVEGERFIEYRYDPDCSKLPANCIF